MTSRVVETVDSDSLLSHYDNNNNNNQRSRNSAVILPGINEVEIHVNDAAEDGDSSLSQQVVRAVNNSGCSSNNRDSTISTSSNSNNVIFQHLPPIKPPSFPPPLPPTALLGNSGFSNQAVYQSLSRAQQQIMLQSPLTMANEHQHPQSTFISSPYATAQLRYQPENEPFLPSPTTPVAVLPCFKEYARCGYDGGISQQQQQVQLYAPTFDAGPPLKPDFPDFPEPAEAAVAKPLAVIAFFFCCQFCFSIPALALAYKRNRPRSNYRTSIGLSVTVIVLGICASICAIAGLILFLTHGEKLREMRDVIFRPSSITSTPSTTTTMMSH